MIAIRFFVITCLFLSVSSSYSMTIYDNRFFPWYRRPYSRTCQTQSRFYCAPFFVMGRKGFGTGLQDQSRLLEIYGSYDQNKVREGIIALGGPDFFDSPALQEFKGQEIIWRMNGKLSGQGVGIIWDHYFGNYISAGLSCFFMHLFSRSILVLSKHNPSGTADEETVLDIARRQMDNYLNLEPAAWEKTAFSDIDLYIRLGNIWEYLYKCRQIDAGIRIGLLVPSGITHSISNPASVPFGGNGLWGMYVALDTQAELKEDLIVGGLLQYNQRFPGNAHVRIPLAGEQQLYGALVTPTNITPAGTLIASPYALFENIREGLGARVQYTVVSHFKDSFSTKLNTVDREKNLKPLSDHSNWVAEYITVDAYYDFGPLWCDSCTSFLVSGMVDIPTKWFFADNAIKTTRLCLGIQFTY